MSEIGGDDREVLGRLVAGDLDALGELYDRYRALAYAVALRITNDSAGAEDVVQESFLGIWRHAARHDDARGSVKTWLLAIVRNRAIDQLRRRRPTVELPDIDGGPLDLNLRVPDVWREVSGRLDRDAVRSALINLPAAQREAIELAYFEGLTQQQIAARMGSPVGTVKGRIRLGLAGLRRTLLNEGAPSAALLAGQSPTDDLEAMQS